MDYRYEKQAYLCRCCKRRFRVPLQRFAPVADLDAIADQAVIESSQLVSHLLEQGAFGAGAESVAKGFAALLATEAYLNRLGERDHRCLEDVVMRAVAMTNELSADTAIISLRRVLRALPSHSQLDIEPCYELDRCKARIGSASLSWRCGTGGERFE